MHINCIEIHAIITFFLIYVSRYTNCQKLTEISKGKTIDVAKGNLTIGTHKIVGPECKGKKCLKYWMSIMGTVQPDLRNIQAIIVKDEGLRGACDKPDRKSKWRYVMCAGSILNRNHVLTSASCMHKATHIRHNVRGALSVVVAPLKPSIQVIRVMEYKIHPAHNTNPYAKNHLTHNVAVLKLSCRIDMENFHKIELPRAPFVDMCSEENCLVAIYRQVKMRSWVMYQTLAPHVPLPNRRRKQTMIKDGELKTNLGCRKNDTLIYANHRSKRKMAKHPVFISRYESRRNNEGSNDTSSTLTMMPASEDTLIEGTTMISDEMENSRFVRARSLKYDEDWLRPVGKERIRSFVVRSSNGHRGCAQTGSPIMFNKTQSAVASSPCDDRQPLARWGYTDLFNNGNWLTQIIQDWTGNYNESSSTSPPVGPIVSDPTKPGSSQGNFSSCSTCIFNFFIEIGCKDKNQCGNKTTTTVHNGPHRSLNSRKYANAMGTTKNHQGCSGGNSVGIEVGIGQGCDKTNEKFNMRPEHRGNWQKSLNPQAPVLGKPKRLPDSTNDEISKLEQSVTVGPIKTSVIKDQQVDKDNYSRKDDPRIASSSRRIFEPPDATSLARNYKISKSDGKNRERVTNEIGLQNIEGDSTDWLSEVEKGLEMSSEVKPKLVNSRRNS